MDAAPRLDLDRRLPRIQRLSDEVVSQIAAGEVVERPASVVKELVENALDAGARNVAVEVEAGGKALVRVRDDGAGMPREDAVLAVERHATSKLRALADLQAIATNGFRGEALAAIGSVSELRLVTREAESGVGTEVQVRHGRVLEVKEAGHPRGTSVEIRDLFGGVPARKKFLRSDATELGHLAEALTLLALARPDVGFTLSARDRKLIEAPAVAERGARVYQLFGAETLRDLQAVAGGADWAQVSGFVPRAKAGARLSLRLFVNGRPVRDRGIAKALSEGYRRAGQGDPRGQAFLFVEAPPHLVDVNVHPAKSEVRFADARVIWEAVTRAVSASLSAGGRAEVTREAPPRAAEVAANAAWSRELPGLAQPTPVPAPPLVEDAGPFVLGQHRNTYVVATDGEELLLVDQHTAHERVRFERLQASLAARSVESQRLLVPVVHEIAPRVRPLIEEHAEALAALGFDVEAFGGGSIRIASVPALLGTRDPGPALEALLRELVEREAADWTVSSTRDRLAATLACHSSVKAGEALSRERMGAIVRDLMKTEHPLSCPHGRPTLARIPREDVTRWFGRTGWRRQ